MVMSDISYSEKLRELSKDYYQSHIQLDEYRIHRKKVLDKIDEEFNDRITEEEKAVEDKEIEDLNSRDKEVDQSVFMSTIAFFKNSDIDQ